MRSIGRIGVFLVRSHQTDVIDPNGSLSRDASVLPAVDGEPRGKAAAGNPVLTGKRRFLVRACGIRVIILKISGRIGQRVGK